jgi:hypothetical protein
VGALLYWSKFKNRWCKLSKDGSAVSLPVVIHESARETKYTRQNHCSFLAAILITWTFFPFFSTLSLNLWLWRREGSIDCSGPAENCRTDVIRIRLMWATICPTFIPILWTTWLIKFALHLCFYIISFLGIIRIKAFRNRRGLRENDTVLKA